MRSTFKLLFYINRQKTKKNGRCPIMGRVTLDGKISQYSTGLEIEPDLWDAKAGKAFTDGRKTGTITGEKRNGYPCLTSTTKNTPDVWALTGQGIPISAI